MPESKIGKVCCCATGTLGVVASIHRTKNGREVYCGISLDGKQWQSLSPQVIAESIEDYYEMHRLRPRHFIPSF
jgi:hypothetical protein